MFKIFRWSPAPLKKLDGAPAAQFWRILLTIHFYKIKDIACHDTTFETMYTYFTKDKITFAIIFLDNVHNNKRLKICNNCLKMLIASARRLSWKTQWHKQKIRRHSGAASGTVWTLCIVKVYVVSSSKIVNLLMKSVVSMTRDPMKMDGCNVF